MSFTSFKTIFSEITIPDVCRFSYRQPSVAFFPGCLYLSPSYFLSLLFMPPKYLSIPRLGHWLSLGSNSFGRHSDLQTDFVGSPLNLLSESASLGPSK